MRCVLSGASLACLATLAVAATPVTVNSDGSADFRSIQSAIDAATQPTTIRIAPGRYVERIHVDRGKPPIALVGSGVTSDQTTLSFGLSAKDVVPPSTQPVGTSGSASVTVVADGFSMQHLTVENTAGDVGQAVAFKSTGDRGVYRDCRFIGWQDTLCVDAGRHLFDRCSIEGRTDFIFGGATAVFDHCEIQSKNGGYVTAARTPATQPFGFVFLDGKLTGDGAPAYLGRPWQWDRGRVAAVALIRCTIGPHIRAEGWHPWSVEGNTDPAKTTRYAEYGSVTPDGKPLDVSKRVKWSKQLTADEARSYTIARVLRGSDGWTPGR